MSTAENSGTDLPISTRLRISQAHVSCGTNFSCEARCLPCGGAIPESAKVSCPSRRDDRVISLVRYVAKAHTCFWHIAHGIVRQWLFCPQQRIGGSSWWEPDRAGRSPGEQAQR